MHVEHHKDAGVAKPRDHIVEGLLKAQGDLDAVVAAVRAAADRDAALAALTRAVEAGEALLREELDACKEMLGERHPDTIASADNFNSLVRAAKLFGGKDSAEESKEN